MTDLPDHMSHLPADKHGRPVPFFASWVNGEPDFRVADGRNLARALKYGLCWVCGNPFYRQENRAFTVGPMCCLNLVSAEPPAHRDCAVYSATACPFLVKPQMVRRERHLPADAVNPAGVMIRRNPGVALVWVTGWRSWSIRRTDDGGRLFDIGDPVEALWYAQGRPATRGEVLAAIDSGLPILAGMAEADGPDAVAELGRMHAAALELVPS